jgi:DNA-binding response OmpR family regulator
LGTNRYEEKDDGGIVEIAQCHCYPFRFRCTTICYGAETFAKSPQLRKIATYTFDMASHTILLVDDDAELGALLIRLFEKHAIAVRHVETIDAARKEIVRAKFDALVLDIMLPDGSGLDLCREIRASQAQLPVLMLSARGETFDRVLGLEIGADDYVAKPFEAMELVARVRAMLRRATRDDTQNTQRAFGDMHIDLLARKVKLKAHTLDLTSAEYKLLLTLSESPAVPLSREVLSRAIQPGAYMPSDRSVDVQVARLRKKLHEVESSHDWVTTVRGEGYVFTLPPKS